MGNPVPDGHWIITAQNVKIPPVLPREDRGYLISDREIQSSDFLLYVAEYVGVEKGRQVDL